MDKKNEYIIDVDIVINNYNKNHPTLKPLNRKVLAGIIGVNPQIFSDWKSGKTPKIIYKLLKLMEIGECGLKDLLTLKNK